MTLPNIGLIGKLRVGKDEVARYLALNHGYMRFAFGDELKADFHRRYPEIPSDPKPRIGYQAHGQLMRALISEDVWVRSCLVRIDRVNRWMSSFPDSTPFRSVIGDVRQPNEYAALKAAGYTLIRVEAPDELRIARAQAAGDRFTSEDLAHPTETALDGYPADFTVTNDAGLPELYAQIDEIVDSLRSSEKESYLE